MKMQENQPTSSRLFRLLTGLGLVLVAVCSAGAQNLLLPYFANLPREDLVAAGSTYRFIIEQHHCGYSPTGGIGIPRPWWGVQNIPGWLAADYEFETTMLQGAPTVNDVGTYRLTVWGKNFYCSPCEASLTLKVFNPKSPANKIFPTSFDFYSGGASDHIDVYAFTNWIATPSVPWISITSTRVDKSGLSAGRVDYTVAANPYATNRQAHINIGTGAAGQGTNFIVRQWAAPTVIISPDHANFASAGGSASVNVTANTTWTATKDATWIHVTSDSSGSGDGAITYTVDANLEVTGRSGSIAIGGDIHVINQLGTAPSVVITPLSRDYGFPGGSGEIAVAANTTWTCSSSTPWVHLTGVTSGSGNGTVAYKVDANATLSSRSGTVTVSGNVHVINQLGNSASIVISPASRAFSCSSGAGAITVTANTSWTASSDASWLTVSSGGSGSGNGMVHYLVGANTANASRTATVSVGGCKHTVTQEAKLPPSISIAPTFANFSSVGGSGTINVMATVNWSAATTSSWIHILSGSTGSSSGLIQYALEANTNASPRSGSISVNAIVSSVNQSGTDSPPVASLTWTGAGRDLCWSNAANWSPPAVPTGNSTVNVTGSTASIQVNTNCAFGRLNLSGGSMYGTLRVGDGQVLNWTGGSIGNERPFERALVIRPGGKAFVDGRNRSVIGMIENDGLLVLSGSISFYRGAADYSGILNRGEVRILNDSLVKSTYRDLSMAENTRYKFANVGTILSQGNTIIEGLPFNNSGVVEILSGSFKLDVADNGDLDRHDSGSPNFSSETGVIRAHIRSASDYGYLTVNPCFYSWEIPFGGGNYQYNMVCKALAFGVVQGICDSGYLPGPNTRFSLVRSHDSVTSDLEADPGTSLGSGRYLAMEIGSTNIDVVARDGVPPSITLQPGDLSVKAGGNANLVVAASGNPSRLAYQWMKDGNALVDGGGINGARTSALSLANLQTADQGDYLVVITNLAGAATSEPVAIRVMPTILVQPQGVTVSAGATASLGVSVDGGGPLSYQWLCNGSNVVSAANLAGVNGPTLILLNAQAANAGNYSVVISNGAGVVRSSAAPLNVVGARPSFSSGGQHITSAAGSFVELSGFAQGTTPMTYQWCRNGVNLVEGEGLVGASTTTLLLYDLRVEDGGDYTLVASNRDGSATNFVASLEVLLSPRVEQGPSDQSVKVGGTFVAQVHASGAEPLSYQWRRNGVDLKNGGRIAGATSSLLSVTGVAEGDAGGYDVVVTNAAGSVTSAPAILSVLVPPEIAVQPVDVITNIGATVTFGVRATGSTNLTFQWRLNGTNLTDSDSVRGAGSNTLTLFGVEQSAAGEYSVEVSNSAGTAISRAASLTLFLRRSYVFVNNEAIMVNDYSRASPYPSTISVSGVPKSVTRISVTLSNVTHSYPSDMQVLLVGSLGQKTLLMSGAGSAMLPDRTFSFSDEALATLPQYEQLVSGTYRPSAWTMSALPSTAPGLPYGTALSTYTNASPDGTWLLYVCDTAKNDSGMIASWSLSFEAIESQLQPPSIAVGPSDQTRIAGDSAVFCVSADGTPPFRYQWLRNGTNCPEGGRVMGTTTPVLELYDLKRGDAGTFAVIVSNAAGAATSSPPAWLRVAPIGFGEPARNGDGTFQLNLYGEVGTRFELQSSADLVTWKRLLVFTNASRHFQFTDPGAASSSKRFYRAIAQ